MTRRRILRDTLLLTAAELALRSVTLLFHAYLSEVLGAVGLGKLQLIGAATSFAMTFGLSGIRVATLNLTGANCAGADAARRKRSVCCCLGYTAVLSAVASVFLILLCPTVADRWIGEPEVKDALRLSAMLVPVNCLTSVLSAYFTARGKVKTLVSVEIVDRLGSVFMTMLLLRNRLGSTSEVCCAVIGGGGICSVFSLGWLFFLLFRDLRGIHGKPEERILPSVLRLSVPLAFGDYLRAGLGSLEQFLIPHGLRKSGKTADAALASYGTVSGMVFPVLMFPAAFIYALCDLLVPELARCKKVGSARRVRFLVGECLGTGIVANVFFAGMIFLLAPALGQRIYHSSEAGRYLRCFAPLIVMLYTDALTDGMLKGLGEQVAGVRYNTLTAALDVLFLWLLLPRCGIGGYFFSFTVTHLVNFALSLNRLCIVSGHTPDWFRAFRVLAAGLFAVAFCERLCPPADAVFAMVRSAAIYAVSYFSALGLFGVMRPADVSVYFRSAGTTSKTVSTSPATRKRTSCPANVNP